MSETLDSLALGGRREQKRRRGRRKDHKEGKKEGKEGGMEGGEGEEVGAKSLGL